MSNPVLNNWMVIKGAHGSFLVGNVYNDLRGKNGRFIRTSMVGKIDEVQGVARTLNTVYDLGMKAK